MQIIERNAGASDEPFVKAAFWPRGWWRLMETRVGIIPLPVYLLLIILLVAFVATGSVPSEISMAIVSLAVGGFTCAELGRRLPFFRNSGAAAIFATFIPSYLAFAHILPDMLVNSVSEFTRSTNFLYLFIAAIIVGSILSMDRSLLIKGFLRIFVPLAAGSIAAGFVGTVVGMAFGLGAYHSFFFIVIPIMAGGVGEGAIPLSVGYATILHANQGELFAEILPSIMMGSLTAILCSGALNYLGKRRPHLTGEGQLQSAEHDEMDIIDKGDASDHVDITHVAAAGITAISLYLVGVLFQRIFGFPAPVVMLFLAVIVKLTQAVSPQLQLGALAVYKFFRTVVTYPLLFAIGVSITPWDRLVAALSLANIVTVVATVMTIMGTGYLVGPLLKMYPIDTAIVNACHSGQGGTGDVAILTAANRMQLMPFAQIATRIGGALTVMATLLLLTQLS